MMISAGVRLSYHKQYKTFILQIALIAVSTGLLIDMPVLSAQISPPANLAAAHAEEFTIAKTIVLDTKAFSPNPAFSHAGTMLAYQRATDIVDKPWGIVIVSLPDGVRRRSIEFKRSLNKIAWSPDDARIFTFDTEGDGYIIDVNTAKSTPLGKVKSAGNGYVGEVIWDDYKSVYFIFERSITRFDLETLSSSNAIGETTSEPLSPRQTLEAMRTGALDAKRKAEEESFKSLAAKLRKTPGDHPYVILGAPQTSQLDLVGGSLIVYNRDDSYTRVLTPQSVKATCSSNAAYAVFEGNILAGTNGQLLLITMGTRQRPRIAFDATLAAMPNPILDSDLNKIKTTLAQGGIIYADVFRPRINPLNQRTVGADGSSKCRVRIIRLGDDGNLEGRVVREVDGYPATGDVVKGFWTPQPNQTEFKSVSGVIGTLRDVPASSIATAVNVPAPATDFPSALTSNGAGAATISKASSAPDIQRDAPAALIDESTKTAQDAAVFPVQTRMFTGNSEMLWAKTMELLAKNGDKVASSDKAKGLIVTELTKHGSFPVARFDKYCIVIQSAGENATKILVKGLLYSPVVGSQRIVARPANRVTEQVNKFLDQLAK